MSDNFIRNIEIKNFKLFKDFKAEGFGRVNLIGGKNNVGKTAFMEAAYVNVSAENIENMYSAIGGNNFIRERLEYVDTEIDIQDERNFFEKTKAYYSVSNIRSCKFEIINKNGEKSYNFTIDNLLQTININNFSYDLIFIQNIAFLHSQGLSNIKLKSFYESVQKKDKEELLYSYLNLFDKNISNFKIIGGDKPQCKVASGEYRDINEFGNGLKHWISIISSLYTCENGYLFIDEIENGIHYTNLDKLWEIILTISKDQNVQVFATTHSKECIESYARVTKKLEDDEISFIELGRNKNDQIKAIVMDSERFYRDLEVGNEVRGW